MYQNLQILACVGWAMVEAYFYLTYFFELPTLWLINDKLLS